MCSLRSSSHLQSQPAVAASSDFRCDANSPTSFSITVQLEQLGHVTQQAEREVTSCFVRADVKPRLVIQSDSFETCAWDSPGKNTGVGCHSQLQGIFPTQGLNPGCLSCRGILFCLSQQGCPQCKSGRAPLDFLINCSFTLLLAALGLRCYA